MTQINLKAGDIAARFLTVAIAKAGSPKELRGKLLADVRLTVNGIDVPLVQTLEQWQQEIDGAVDARALALAQAMLSEAGLAPAARAIQLANITVKRALTEAHQRLRDKGDPSYVDI
jgi:hypothetical protein